MSFAGVCWHRINSFAPKKFEPVAGLGSMVEQRRNPVGPVVLNHFCANLALMTWHS